MGATMKNVSTKEIAPLAATGEAKVNLLQNIRNKYKGDSSAAQRTRLLEALRFLSLSTLDIRRYLDILHPAGRVQELREEGHKIETSRRREFSEAGLPHNVARYVLQAGQCHE